MRERQILYVENQLSSILKATLIDAYTAPKAKINASSSFLLVVICNFRMTGIGMMYSIKSVSKSVEEATVVNSARLTHFPGISGSKSAAIGTQ